MDKNGGRPIILVRMKRNPFIYLTTMAPVAIYGTYLVIKKGCLKEEQADKAFNKERKSACYVFYQHSDDALILENASSFTADDLINEYDIYVVDKEFNWTYVKTHETGWCGPYFSRKNDR
jgi:hypothetical protein